MKAEIERKFKAGSVPAEILASADSSDSVDQGYLVLSEGAEARIRKKGDSYFLTVKKGSGLSRLESEIVITEGQFGELWPATDGSRVEKVRHNVRIGDGLVAEVDIFSGANEGLILIETEFQDERQAASFQPPPWFGVDVTGDPAYKNALLAK